MTNQEQTRKRDGFKGTFPNFFLIGAPKSGTTALSEYLRRHPDILFSTPKEPHYFNSDFSSRGTTTLKDYQKCFSEYSGEIAIGEGSVFYLRSNVAVKNILSRVPNAKLIVMLRNPIEAVYSFHWQVVYSHEENISNFEKAWSLQSARAQGLYIPRRNRVREVLQYGPLFKYGEQLERLFRIAPKNQVKIILYDDFRSAPGLIYKETLQFLDLKTVDLKEYEVINQSKRMRNPVLEEILEFVDKGLLACGIKTNFGLKTFLNDINTKYTERPALRPEIKSELLAYYRNDIQITSKLIKRNLDGWIDE